MRKQIYLLFVGFVFALLLFSGSGIVSGHAQSDTGWAEPINISRSGSVSNPLLVIDSNGVHHSIWIDIISEGYKYAYSADGVVWSTPVPVNFPFKIQDPAPRIFSSSDGMLHIFWQEENNSLHYTNVTFTTFSTPGGWSSEELAPSVTDYDAYVDDQDGIQIAYIRNLTSASNPSGVYYQYSSSGGGAWSQARLLQGSDYLRSTLSGDAHVSISSVVDDEGQRVYVAWDDKFQKGIYMTRSSDAGTTWETPRRVIGSEDVIGRSTPYNVEVASFKDRIMLTWQIGEPDISRCSLYSQWSFDSGDEWNDPVKVIDDIFDCPKAVKFISTSDVSFVASLETENEISLVAWNNSRWSSQQVQSSVLNLVNPLTYDAIQFSCQSTFFYQDHLYVVGCDNWRGGDVWYTYRQIDDVDTWFLPPMEWDGQEVLVDTTQRISSLSFVRDDTNSIHAFWVQSPPSIYDVGGASIHYARWDGEQWLFDATIFGGLSGLPTELSARLDADGRIFLTWVDANKGDLLFTWAYADKADIPTEWQLPQPLPSISQWASAPDVLVDAAGKIVVIYAVPLNDSRGIYIVESVDSGLSWSLPITVFDATLKDWGMVDNPEIALDKQGVLHALFGRYDISKIDQSKGLYYSQSSDGGLTWSEAQLIIERPVFWSELTNYDDHIVHLFWQEKHGSVFAARNQISDNDGIAWNAPFDVANVQDRETQTTLVADRTGYLHLFQIVDVDRPKILGWRWDNENADWRQQESIQLNDRYHGGHFSIVADVTGENYLNVSVSVEYTDVRGQLNNEILSFWRYEDERQSDSEALPPVIAPTPVSVSNEATTIPPVEQLSTPIPPFADQAGASLLSTKNVIGIVLVVLAILIILFLIGRRRK